MIEKIKEYKTIAIVIVGCVVAVVLAVISGIGEVKGAIEIVEADIVLVDSLPIIQIDTLVVDSLVVDSL